jgi:hypothetical protein
VLENGVRAPNRLMARNCSLSTAFAYCPVANRGWPDTDSYVFGKLAGIPLRSASLDIFRTKLGQEHSSRQVRSFEASAKASAHLSRNQSLPSAGTLPAWSKLNDLVRLRAAIITSCICGATKELKQSPAGLTFLVRRPGFRVVAPICGLW